MDQPQDRFSFLMEQRRKFLKEFSAFAGFAMVTGAELCRGEPISISGDPRNDDKDWGSVKGRIVFDGDIPERSEVDLEKVELSPTDKKWFQSAGPILTEDWVINKENRGVQWIFIWLIPENADKDREAKLEIHDSLKTLSADKKFIEIEQEPMGYVPHAAAIQEGMGLLMKNTGPVAHVFNLTGFKNESFSKAMPPKENIEIKDLKAERTPNKITCPPHPWERMWLKIFDHPYYAVTDENGGFEIKNAPAGKCRLVVWQESIGYKGGRTGRYGQVIEIEGAAKTDLGDIQIEAKTT